MPKWLHDRAEHLLAKNPEMSKSQAFAIATQQSHALGKTPKGYGTSEARSVAKKKFNTPKDDVKTANPGIKKEAQVLLPYLNGFSDELEKIAAIKIPQFIKNEVADGVYEGAKKVGKKYVLPAAAVGGSLYALGRYHGKKSERARRNEEMLNTLGHNKQAGIGAPATLGTVKKTISSRPELPKQTTNVPLTNLQSGLSPTIGEGKAYSPRPSPPPPTRV